MTKSSCIQHPAQAALVILRDEYLQICEGHHCAAMLLSVFEYWHNIKLGNLEQVEMDSAIAEKTGVAAEQSGELWVYKTQANLKADLLGLFGESKVLSATRLLIKLGFVSTRTNPRYAWDHTTQYLFYPSKVQSAITQKYVVPSRKSKQSSARNYAIKDPKSKGTIPETTTETTAKIKEKEVPLVESVPVTELTPAEMKEQGAILFQEVLNKLNGNMGITRKTDAQIAEEIAIAEAKYGTKGKTHVSR
jgi:hypothetical protein